MRRIYILSTFFIFACQNNKTDLPNGVYRLSDTVFLNMSENVETGHKEFIYSLINAKDTLTNIFEPFIITKMSSSKYSFASGAEKAVIEIKNDNYIFTLFKFSGEIDEISPLFFENNIEKLNCSCNEVSWIIPDNYKGRVYVALNQPNNDMFYYDNHLVLLRKDELSKTCYICNGYSIKYKNSTLEYDAWGINSGSYHNILTTRANNTKTEFLTFIAK